MSKPIRYAPISKAALRLITARAALLMVPVDVYLTILAKVRPDPELIKRMIRSASKAT